MCLVISMMLFWGLSWSLNQQGDQVNCQAAYSSECYHFGMKEISGSLDRLADSNYATSNNRPDACLTQCCNWTFDDSYYSKAYTAQTIVEDQNSNTPDTNIDSYLQDLAPVDIFSDFRSLLSNFLKLILWFSCQIVSNISCAIGHLASFIAYLAEERKYVVFYFLSWYTLFSLRLGRVLSRLRLLSLGSSHLSRDRRRLFDFFGGCWWIDDLKILCFVTSWWFDLNKGCGLDFSCFLSTHTPHDHEKYHRSNDNCFPHVFQLK